MCNLPYVVLGRFGAPTKAQEKLAADNGGWEERCIDEVDVLWNSKVSPPVGKPYRLGQHYKQRNTQ